MAKADERVLIDVSKREILPYGREALRRVVAKRPAKEILMLLSAELQFKGNHEARAEYWKAVALAAMEEMSASVRTMNWI